MLSWHFNVVQIVLNLSSKDVFSIDKLWVEFVWGLGWMHAITGPGQSDHPNQNKSKLLFKISDCLIKFSDMDLALWLLIAAYPVCFIFTERKDMTKHFLCTNNSNSIWIFGFISAETWRGFFKISKWIFEIFSKNRHKFSCRTIL